MSKAAPQLVRTTTKAQPAPEETEEEKKRRRQMQMRREEFLSAVTEIEDALEHHSAVERMAAMDRILLVFGKDPDAAFDKVLSTHVPELVERIAEFLPDEPLARVQALALRTITALYPIRPTTLPTCDVYPPPLNGLPPSPLVRVVPSTTPHAASANPPVVNHGEHPTTQEVLTLTMAFLGAEHGWDVRMAAAQATARVAPWTPVRGTPGTSSASATLAKLIEEEGDVRVREEALRALLRIFPTRCDVSFLFSVFKATRFRTVSLNGSCPQVEQRGGRAAHDAPRRARGAHGRRPRGADPAHARAGALHCVQPRPGQVRTCG